jgi:hypothetical protein
VPKNIPIAIAPDLADPPSAEVDSRLPPGSIPAKSMITLINPPGIKTFSSIQMQTPNAPIGLVYIAAVIKEAGYRYKVIDGVGEAMDTISPYPQRSDMMIQGLTYDQIVDRIPADTDIIGLTCMFSTLWPITREIAIRVRERFPTQLIVLGGEHATAVPEITLRSSPIDMICLGDGFDTVLAIIDGYRRNPGSRDHWSGIKGIAYLAEDGAMVSTGLSARKRNVDAIPLPDWDAIPIREYIDRHQTNGANIGRSMPLIATWGCPYDCTFCSNAAMWTKRWIPRSPKLVVDEMALYKEKFGVTNFDFQDLTAMIKRRWVLEFTSELASRNLGVTWQLPSGTRAEVFDEEVAKALYASGLRLLSFAPESGSEEMLKLIKKQVDLPKMHRCDASGNQGGAEIELLHRNRVSGRNPSHPAGHHGTGAQDGDTGRPRRCSHQIRSVSRLGLVPNSTRAGKDHPGR